MDKVLMKLSEMILDEKIRGTLDQGRNCLIIFDEAEPTEMFDYSLKTIKNLETVMDSLYEKTHMYRQKYLK
jgi:26S proteasome regulatory subunit N6